MNKNEIQGRHLCHWCDNEGVCYTYNNKGSSIQIDLLNDNGYSNDKGRWTIGLQVRKRWILLQSQDATLYPQDSTVWMFLNQQTDTWERACYDCININCIDGDHSGKSLEHFWAHIKKFKDPRLESHDTSSKPKAFESYFPKFERVAHLKLNSTRSPSYQFPRSSCYMDCVKSVKLSVPQNTFSIRLSHIFSILEKLHT